jgi:hypothetical protein
VERGHRGIELPGHGAHGLAGRGWGPVPQPDRPTG